MRGYFFSDQQRDDLTSCSVSQVKFWPPAVDVQFSEFLPQSRRPSLGRYTPLCTRHQELYRECVYRSTLQVPQPQKVSSGGAWCEDAAQLRAARFCRCRFGDRCGGSWAIRLKATSSRVRCQEYLPLLQGVACFFLQLIPSYVSDARRGFSDWVVNAGKCRPRGICRCPFFVY